MRKPHHGTLLSNKKKQSIDGCNRLYRSQGNYAEWGKKSLKRCREIDSIPVTFSKRENSRDEYQTSGCQYLGN